MPKTFHFHIWHYQPYNPQTHFWDGEKISGDKKDKMRSGSSYLFISWSENILDKNSLKGCRVDSGPCEVWMWRYGRWHVVCLLSQVFGLSQVFLGTEIDNLMGTFFSFCKVWRKKISTQKPYRFLSQEKPGTVGQTWDTWGDTWSHAGCECEHFLTSQPPPQIWLKYGWRLLWFYIDFLFSWISSHNLWK